MTHGLSVFARCSVAWTGACVSKWCARRASRNVDGCGERGGPGGSGRQGDGRGSGPRCRRRHRRRQQRCRRRRRGHLRKINRQRPRRAARSVWKRSYSYFLGASLRLRASRTALASCTTAIPSATQSGYGLHLHCERLGWPHVHWRTVFVAFTRRGEDVLATNLHRDWQASRMQYANGHSG